MNRSTSILLTVLALLSGCGGAASTGTVTTAESTEVVASGVPAHLVIGGDSANFGTHSLTTGFMPDPAIVDVVSGGNLDASTANTGGVACAGWVTAQPDVIVNFDEMSGFLRFAFRPNNDGEDATLVINDGQGNWHCNDDASGLNPVIDLADAPPGQYDIWIGSYSASENIAGQLLITELSEVMP